MISYYPLGVIKFITTLYILYLTWIGEDWLAASDGSKALSLFKPQWCICATPFWCFLILSRCQERPASALLVGSTADLFTCVVSQRNSWAKKRAMVFRSCSKPFPVLQRSNVRTQENERNVWGEKDIMKMHHKMFLIFAAEIPDSRRLLWFSLEQIYSNFEIHPPQTSTYQKKHNHIL